MADRAKELKKLLEEHGVEMCTDNLRDMIQMLMSEAEHIHQIFFDVMIGFSAFFAAFFANISSDLLTEPSCGNAVITAKIGVFIPILLWVGLWNFGILAFNTSGFIMAHKATMRKDLEYLLLECGIKGKKEAK